MPTLDDVLRVVDDVLRDELADYEVIVAKIRDRLSAAGQECEHQKVAFYQTANGEMEWCQTCGCLRFGIYDEARQTHWKPWILPSRQPSDDYVFTGPKQPTEYATVAPLPEGVQCGPSRQPSDDGQCEHKATWGQNGITHCQACPAIRTFDYKAEKWSAWHLPDDKQIRAGETVVIDRLELERDDAEHRRKAEAFDIVARHVSAEIEQQPRDKGYAEAMKAVRAWMKEFCPPAAPAKAKPTWVCEHENEPGRCWHYFPHGDYKPAACGRKPISGMPLVGGVPYGSVACVKCVLAWTGALRPRASRS